MTQESSTRDAGGDATGWCQRNEHSSCSGELRAASGYHWYCTCPCHGEPPKSGPGSENRMDFKRAYGTWFKAQSWLAESGADRTVDPHGSSVAASCVDSPFGALSGAVSNEDQNPTSP